MLLKLHGSSNWLWCRKCGLLRVETSLNLQESLIKEPNASHHNYSKDRVPLTVAIVPPIWAKQLKWGPFPQIWNQARDALVSAKNLLIIGVGFRLADIELRNLLRETSASWKRAPNVTLVGHSVDDEQYVRTVSELIKVPKHKIKVARDLRQLLGKRVPWTQKLTRKDWKWIKPESATKQV